MILPLAFFFLFFIFPMVYAIYISRYDWGVLGPIERSGSRTTATSTTTTSFGRALRNVLVYTLFVVPGQMALGLLAAVIVNQKIHGRPFFRAAFYFPSLASSAAIVAIFIYLLNADGLVNSILGTQHHVLRRLRHGAAVDHGPEHLDDVGDDDALLPRVAPVDPDGRLRGRGDRRARGRGARSGRSPSRCSSPAHFFVLVVSIIGCLKVFDQMYIVSGGTGGPNYSTLSVVLYMYQTAISDLRWGYAAAIGVVLFLMIFVFTLVQRLLFGRAEVS